MTPSKLAAAAVLAAILAACGQGRQETETTGEPQATDVPAPAPEPAEPVEITPGLTIRVLRPGDGAEAAAGQVATVHYTGWLYDPAAPDNRGDKFDSSLDRGQPFPFPIGAGRVIRGWDQGVAGMKIGEVRELTIAPELAYGSRSVGELIPANSTLVFEVELLELSGE